MEVEVGSRVRFKPGREGTFDSATELVVKDIVSGWAIFEIGRLTWPILVERLEVVDG